MKNKPVHVFLIPFSLLLLTGFQYVWLRKEYKDQYEFLKKETRQLFVSSINGIQDSLIKSSTFKMESVPFDMESSSIFKEKNEFHKADTIRRSTFVYIKDSIRMRRDSFPHAKDISVLISMMDTDKQVDKLLNKVVVNVKNQEPTTQRFVIKLDCDTLPVKQIRAVYQKNLEKAGIGLPFTILRASEISQQHPLKGITVESDFSGLPFADNYRANFAHYEVFLFRKLLPQILFSLFLLGMTSLAFWQINRSLQQQRKLTDLKNDFISNVTHELKTPIATVSVAIEALSNFNALQNPERTQEYLDISRNELNRLSILVDKVLRMAIFEKKEPELTFEQVDLAMLIRQILASMKLQFEKSGAEVSFEGPEEGFNMDGDRLHLTSVVYNLIDNALKYNATTPVIRISLEAVSDRVQLQISDNGPGIAPEYREKVFEKLFRIPTGDVHNIKGHGLGLSYVASVIAKHNGYITIESQPGKGSHFIIDMPRYHAES